MNSSPLSPLFNFEPVCFHSHELKSYLLDLAERNKKLVANFNPLEVKLNFHFSIQDFLSKSIFISKNQFKNGKIAMFLFNVCEKIEASKNAMFMSIELYDK